MSVKDNLKPSEIGAVMCAVAIDNTWRRGKRNFMVTRRDLFGIILSVRHKYGSDLVQSRIIALTSVNWRIALKGIVRLSSIGDRELVKVPMVTGTRTTLIQEQYILDLEFDIKNEAAFDRDWTLLRLFSGEWKQFYEQ